MNIYSIGKTLIRRYKNAISDRNNQYEAHRGFTASLLSKQAPTWEAMCVAWDEDGFPKSVPNPFKTNDVGEIILLHMLNI